MKVSLENLLATCDAQQREAIESERQPLLVMASAGSGKTKVLTYRIYRRVVTQEVALSHILAITFTRKAAANMKTRLAAFGLPRTISIGTFHAIALSCVKEYYANKRRSPTILTNKASILADILTKHPDLNMASTKYSSYGLNRSATHKPKGYPFSSTTNYLKALERELDLISSNMLSGDTDPTSMLQHYQNKYIPQHVISEVFKLYRAEKEKRNLLDFDDLIVHLGDLIKSDSQFGNIMRWKYRHVFVDEIQDMTLAQLNLLKEIVSPNRDLFGVGDVRQSIYEWNGAVKDIETTFKDYFPDTHIMHLSTNYRSTPQIVNVASALIENTDITAVQESGPVPKITVYQDATQEALGIAKAIRTMKFKVAGYHEIAVLVRTNAQCDPIIEAMQNLGIPVQKNILPSLLSLMRDIAGQFSDSAAGLQMMLRDIEMLLASVSKQYMSNSELGFPEEDPARIQNGISEDIVLFFPHISQEHLKGEKLTIINNIQTLYNIAKDYIEFEVNPNISGFLNWISLSRRNDIVNGENDAVQVLTFHKAKGLEWKVVFLAGLEEGLVPIQGAVDESALAEEKRLLYVAATRATYELHMSYAIKRGNAESKRMKSRWLTEIEKAIDDQIRMDAIDAEKIKWGLREAKRLLKKGEA